MKYSNTNEQNPCHLCEYEKNADGQAENIVTHVRCPCSMVKVVEWFVKVVRWLEKDFMVIV